jgi:uncharacterized protein YcfJ
MKSQTAKISTRISTTLVIAMLVFAGVANAADKQQGHKKSAHEARHDLYEYATVLEARPLYREVKVSTPVRECWDEPVYHTRSEPKSAGGMLAGGLLGGIIGHQIGNGRGKRVATAMGTLIGAQIGHQAVNANVQSETVLSGYEEHCKTHQRVNYEEVQDGYDVTYEYRGRQYQLVMPYDPGKRIKMRIEFTPVI